MFKHGKRNSAQVTILRGSFLFMYFNFGVRSLVAMVVTVMMANLVLTTTPRFLQQEVSTTIYL